MGGLKIRTVESSGDERLSTPTHDETQEITFSTAWAFYQWLRDNPPLAAEYVDTKQIEVDIADKSNADSLLKAITVAQASWLVVQTVDRACNKQSVSPLEVTTCAYVLCAVFTYACWWRKPYGVQRPLLLLVPNSESYHQPEDSGLSPEHSKSMAIIRTIAFIASGCMGCLLVLFIAPYGMKHLQVAMANCSVTAPAIFVCFIQFCARLVTFILIGYSFWSLPVDVYSTTHWTWSWLPHIG